MFLESRSSLVQSHVIRYDFGGMRYLFLVVSLLWPVAQSDILDDLMWVENNSFCKGYFKPLDTNLPTLPEDQTVLITEKDSHVVLGADASLNSVTVEQNELKIFSEKAKLKLDQENQLEVLKLDAKSRYHAPKLLLYAESGVFNIKQDKVNLNQVTYRIKMQDSNAWGTARTVRRDASHRYIFEDATISNCSPNDNIWSIRARIMIYDPDRHLVTLIDPQVMNYDSVLVGWPYLDFATEGRKSGWLKPDIHWTPYGGVALFLPYYLNLATNADLVLTPTIVTERGLGLQSDLNYLTESTSGNLKLLGLLDQAAKTSRYQILWGQKTQLRKDLDLHVNLSEFSDTDIFRDFGNYFNLADTMHPVESATLSWTPEGGILNVGFTDFHNDFVEDSATLADVRFVSFSPDPLFLKEHIVLTQQFNVSRYTNVAASNQGEFGSKVDRATADLSMTYDWSRPYLFFRPKVSSVLRWYRTEDVAVYKDAIPRFQVSTGLNFEKFGDGYYQTLSPQITYLYTPYKDQNSVPILNTSLKSTNDISTFYEAGRFLGIDRIEDNNAIMLGVTSRVQFKDYFWDFSGGQQINFTPPQVCLDPNCQGETGSTADFAPLFFSVTGTYPAATTSTHLSYDTDLHIMRSLGSVLTLKTPTLDALSIDYEYDARSGSNNDVVTELSRLGINAEYRVSPLYKIKPKVFHDFKNSRTTSYEIVNVFKSCCWTTEFKLGRRYTGTDDNSDKEYQWYASFWLYLDGFS